MAGFAVCASLLAQTHTQSKPAPAAPAAQDDRAPQFFVVDEQGAVVSSAHIVIRNSIGNAIAKPAMDPTGVFQSPALPPGSYHFVVSAHGFGDFKDSFAVPIRWIPIRVVLKDYCHSPGVNCDEYPGTPVLLDTIEPDINVVIEPYPLLAVPPGRRPGFFKRVFSRLLQRPS